jgi:hypothetical protein
MNQILDNLSPELNEGIYQLYLDAHWYATEQLDDDDLVMETFQTLLNEVPTWDEDMISRKTKAIIKKAPWLRTILTELIVQQVRVMVGKDGTKTKKLSDFTFNLPSDQAIVHGIYKQIAREMKGHIHLYQHDVSQEQRANNTYRAQEIVRKRLKRTIRNLVPIEEVAKRHLSQKPPKPKLKTPKAPPPSPVSAKDEEEEESSSEEEEEEAAEPEEDQLSAVLSKQKARKPSPPPEFRDHAPVGSVQLTDVEEPMDPSLDEEEPVPPAPIPTLPGVDLDELDDLEY